MAERATANNFALRRENPPIAKSCEDLHFANGFCQPPRAAGWLGGYVASR